MPGERRPGMDHALYAYSALPQRAPLRWPGGNALAFWAILYLEHWELDPPPGSYRPPGIAGVRESFFPDYRTHSHREYGNRVGVFRVIEVLEELGIRPTVALNAAMCRSHPRLLRACLDRGWEIAVHGTHATRMVTSQMSEAQEREHIGWAIDEVRDATGRLPRGWIGQEFGESTRTPAIVAGHGLSYLADWPNDEQPYPMLGNSGLISLPQQAQWDDVQLLWLRNLSSVRYPQIVQSACDVLLAEGAHHGRMLGLGIHPWLSGQAHRIRYLREALAYVMARPGVWQADGEAIATQLPSATRRLGGPMKKTRVMRELLAQKKLLVSPNVYDGYSALLVAKMGFQAAATTGAGLSNSQFGLPDIGLMSLMENVDICRKLARMIPIPLMADADTGYGNAVSVYYSTQYFEEAGVVGINIEDQVSPKRCGHMQGKQLIEPREMVKKIEAAAKARKDADFIINARTDAIAVEGFDKAVARLKDYVAAGADMVFSRDRAQRRADPARGGSGGRAGQHQHGLRHHEPGHHAAHFLPAAGAAGRGARHRAAPDAGRRHRRHDARAAGAARQPGARQRDRAARPGGHHGADHRPDRLRHRGEAGRRVHAGGRHPAALRRRPAAVLVR